MPRKRNLSARAVGAPAEKRKLSVVSVGAPDASAIPVLSAEQQSVVDCAVAGHNVVFSGPAGAGKTTVAQAICRVFGNLGIFVHRMALSAKAAENLGGWTIHSFVFKDLGLLPVEHYVAMWRANKWSMRKWKSTRVILIDEVSMVGRKLFEKFDAVARGVLGVDKPFGGIQILACGDFYQLPPIDDDFMFESPLFLETFTRRIELNTVYRQSGDPAFLRALNDVRTGPMTDETYAFLLTRVGKLPPPGQPAIRIFPKNKDVNYYNLMKLVQLPEPEHTFEYKFVPCASYTAAQNNAILHAMLKAGSFLPKLKLRVGAFVYYTVNNLQLKKRNGSMGKVVAFEEETNMPVVEFVDGDRLTIGITPIMSKCKMCSVEQVPLKLAWAGTVHKLQGLQFDSGVIDLGANIFEFGQGYSALSRFFSADGIFIQDLDRDSILPHPKVVEFYATSMNVQPH